MTSISQSSPSWLITYTAATKYLPETLSQTILSSPGNFVIFGPNQHPGGIGAQALIDVKSVAALQSQLQLGVPNGVYGVVVDLEHWSFTPLQEQQNPEQYYEEASTLLHSRGLKLVATPGLDLFKGVGKGPLYEQILSSGLYTSLAKIADVVDIQAQSLENSPALYAQFVTSAARQIRDANPSVTILAGLTTSGRNGVVPTGSVLVEDASAVQSSVSGFWINIPSPGATCPTCSALNPIPAIDLLQSYLH